MKKEEYVLNLQQTLFFMDLMKKYPLPKTETVKESQNKPA
jgi:hypothetical protein